MFVPPNRRAGVEHEPRRSPGAARSASSKTAKTPAPAICSAAITEPGMPKCWPASPASMPLNRASMAEAQGLRDLRLRRG